MAGLVLGSALAEVSELNLFLIEIANSFPKTAQNFCGATVGLVSLLGYSLPKWPYCLHVRSCVPAICLYRVHFPSVNLGRKR